MIQTRQQDALPYATIDPQSPIPLYHQVYLDLRQMIQRGLIPPGGLLPPEMDICQAYGVGRQTIRQAISRLVDDDLVERFAGRGTFVREQPSHTQFFLDRSFSQQMREMGRMPKSRLLSVERGVIGDDALPVFAGCKGMACVTVERVRLGDDEPICYQISTVLAERCPGLEQHDFASRSLYEILSTRYHLLVSRIDHIVRAVAADEYRADLLGVPGGAPLLFVGTTAYLEAGEVIEHSSAYYRADRYAYSTTQTY